MLTFVGPRPEGYQVDHIDRNRLNNRLDNLRYVSKSDNMRNRENYTFGKRKAVLQINAKGEIKNTFESLNEAHRQTGIPLGNIWKVCKGERKTAGGYRWEYVERG